jgi:hypothetical protein
MTYRYQAVHKKQGGAQHYVDKEYNTLRILDSLD